MIRLSPMLALALVACTMPPVPLPATQPEVRPVVAEDQLMGRWAVESVNGHPAPGLWVELGAEGLATITRTGTAVFVASPLPPTRAFLGCNNWNPSGWTRTGDKLTLGVEMSHRTERGCDPVTMALDDEAYAILAKTLTMEFTGSDRLRLINERGAIELVRNRG
jgi:hypothetical protein